MDRHQVGAGVAELLHIPARLHDHQVNIQGHAVVGRMDFTTGIPMVMLGTNMPSITSTWT